MSYSILDYISSYDKITIQCHNYPDADALTSAWAVYLYLQGLGKKARIVYGGNQLIKKRNLQMLIHLCEIPVEFIGNENGQDKFYSLESDELLLVVDTQYGGTNLDPVKADHWAVIDHHPAILEASENVLIRSDCQSCATIMWDLLSEKNYPVDENEKLKIALAYALFTDTSEYADLHNDLDIRMKNTVGTDYPELDSLKKANLTMSDLMIAADALYHNFADFDERFMIVSALKCDKTILGVIGDLAIQVDMIELVVSITGNESGYHYSLRTSGKRYRANVIARCICEGIGSGGGHPTKAAGFISSLMLQEKHPGKSVEEVVTERIRSWIREN